MAVVYFKLKNIRHSITFTFFSASNMEFFVNVADSPTFSLAKGPSVQVATITSGEEDEDDEPPKSFVAPSVPKTAIVFEGEEEEEDETASTAPITEAYSAPPSNSKSSDKDGTPKSCVVSLLCRDVLAWKTH